MSRLTYTKALDNLLGPLGFQREKRVWTRIRGDLQEQLDLQKSWIDGSVTVNLWSKDLETERLLAAIDCEAWLGIRQFGVRIGNLVDGRDRWWKNNPNGPTEVADLVRTYGVPWFDTVHSLEDQAIRYGRKYVASWNTDLIVLAVTLYRMGELDEALSRFEAPVPKTVIPTLVTEGRCVQRWLQSKKVEG